MRTFIRRYLGQQGLSLVEGIMGAGMLSVAAFGFASLNKNAVNSTQSLEARYTKMDVEQSVRSAFMNSDSCKCAFAGHTLSAGGVTNIADIKLTDPSCGNARPIITSGTNVTNSTLKVQNISVRNVTSFSPTEMVADLHVAWKNPGQGLSMKPSIMKNLRFVVDGAGAVLGCGFMPDKQTPENCGYGKICVSGKQVQFFNDPAYAAPLSASSQGMDADGWLGVFLQAPSGRATMLKLKEVNGTLKFMVPHGNWRPQLCWYHFMPNACHFFSDIGTNCGSSIHWKYYDGVNPAPQSGNTGNNTLRVPNPSPGSPEKPFTSC